MDLFYHKMPIERGVFMLNQEDSKHICKVLRHSVGDELYITDGKGHIYECLLRAISHKGCTVEVITQNHIAQKPFHIHLAVAPTKAADRYEWLVEKATELGISELSPIICEHSERKSLNIDRLEKIAVAAMKQSASPYLPKINVCIRLQELLKSSIEGQKYIAHCRPSLEKLRLEKLLTKSTSVLVLIGPEGDFSTSEVEAASNYGYIPVSLGQTRLRTETAAIAACHTVALVNEL